MSTVLKRITARARRIRKAHPSIRWTAAIKKASAEIKGAKTVSRKKTAPKKKAAVRRTVAVKRVSVASSVGSSVSSLMSQLKLQLKSKYGDLAAKKLVAKGVRDKKKIQKQMNEVAAQIRKIN